MEMLMTRKQAAEYLGLAPQTLASWACYAKGPRFKKIGKYARYAIEDIECWLKEQGLADLGRQAAAYIGAGRK